MRQPKVAHFLVQFACRLWKTADVQAAFDAENNYHFVCVCVCVGGWVVRVCVCGQGGGGGGACFCA